MKQTLSKYIDNNIIDEYANKKSRDGYSLDVSDIPKHDIENFLSYLFEHDEVMEELVLDRMQDLIDEELPLAECKDKYEQGYFPKQDQSNGEIYWAKMRIVA
jgi:hypothetical protein